MSYRYLTKEQLEKLPTPRLLKYKKKYFSHRYHNEWDSDEDLAEENVEYDFIKDLLAKREHVE